MFPKNIIMNRTKASFLQCIVYTWLYTTISTYKCNNHRNSDSDMLKTAFFFFVYYRLLSLSVYEWIPESPHRVTICVTVGNECEFNVEAGLLMILTGTGTRMMMEVLSQSIAASKAGQPLTCAVNVGCSLNALASVDCNGQNIQQPNLASS